jgi:mono/diheme cytochrome c family protein
MRRLTTLASVLLLVPLIATVGCQSGGGGAGAKAPASGSKYDSGPRAGEQPIDEELAEQGEQVFRTKGCSACHAFGTKMSGPDLKGVSMRRTAEWMEHQILEPEVMVKEDPISRALFAQYALQMTNQHLTPAEAKAVIEYLKHKDHEAGETREGEER